MARPPLCITVCCVLVMAIMGCEAVALPGQNYSVEHISDSAVAQSTEGRRTMIEEGGERETVAVPSQNHSPNHTSGSAVAQSTEGRRTMIEEGGERETVAVPSQNHSPNHTSGSVVAQSTGGRRTMIEEGGERETVAVPNQNHSPNHTSGSVVAQSTEGGHTMIEETGETTHEDYWFEDDESPDRNWLETGLNTFLDYTGRRLFPMRTAAGVRFKLHTRQGTDVLRVSHTSVAASRFNSSHPTTVLVHGFFTRVVGLSMWIGKTVKALLSKGPWNVIVVDWTRLCSIFYPATVIRARAIPGQVAAQLLRMLEDVKGLDISTLHVIGFSLGAHVAGFIGQSMPGIGRITGLDPAGPLFRSVEPHKRLSPDDALFVDIVNTNVGSFIAGFSLGINRNLNVAHVQVNFNGGVYQPGCGVADSCSHRRAPDYLIESIKMDKDFMVYPCEGSNETRPVPFGLAMPPTTRGCYFATANRDEPYLQTPLPPVLHASTSSDVSNDVTSSNVSNDVTFDASSVDQMLGDRRRQLEEDSLGQVASGDQALIFDYLDQRTVLESDQLLEHEQVMEHDHFKKPEQFTEHGQFMEQERFMESEGILQPERIREPEQILKPMQVFEVAQVSEPGQVLQPEPLFDLEQLVNLKQLLEPDQLVQPETLPYLTQYLPPEKLFKPHKLSEPDQIMKVKRVFKSEQITEPKQVFEPDEPLKSNQILYLQKIMQEKKPLKQELTFKPEQILEPDQILEPNQILERYPFLYKPLPEPVPKPVPKPLPEPVLKPVPKPLPEPVPKPLPKPVQLHHLLTPLRPLEPLEPVRRQLEVGAPTPRRTPTLPSLWELLWPQNNMEPLNNGEEIQG